MTPPQTARPAWLDHGLVQTNPVHVAELYRDKLDGQFEDPLERAGALRRFAEQLRVMARTGGRVPDRYVESVREFYLPADFRLDGGDTAPRPFGVVADPTGGEPLVVPLRPERLGPGTNWDVERSLPFGGEQIEDGLVHLVRAALPGGAAVPERLTYRFRNPLGREINGDSMTVAAVLAVLDVLTGGTDDRLRAAVALVRPVQGGDFVRVEHVEGKLTAALREHDSLSLTLVPPEFTVPDGIATARLGQIRPVRSYSELAEWLGPNVMNALLSEIAARLTRAEVVRLRDLVRQRSEHADRYGDAASLAGRLLAVEPGRVEPVSASVWADVRACHAAAARHGGRFTSAIRYAERIAEDVIRLRALGAASDDEVAYAVAEREAALYDAHRFERIEHELAPLVTAISNDRERFRPITRIMVWNTLARARMILGPDGWEPLFRQSEALLRVVDSTEIPRTRCYLIRGLLRAGQTAKARDEIESLGAAERPAAHAESELVFLRADLARRTGERWDHGVFETAEPGPHVPGYVLGFYFQATARQPRSAEQVEHRLGRAAALLDGVSGRDPENICTLFADAVRVYAAARSGNAEGWRRAVTDVRAFLARPTAAGPAEYYRQDVVGLPENPCLTAAERLIDSVPYF